MHEQRILGTAEVASQYVSWLQTLYRHFIERMGAYVESMRDMRLTLGSAIEVGQSDALASSTMTTDRKSTRLNSSHLTASRMPSSA